MGSVEERYKYKSLPVSVLFEYITKCIFEYNQMYFYFFYGKAVNT